MSEKEEVNVKNEETKTPKKGTKKSTTTKKSSTTTKKATTSKTATSKTTAKKTTAKSATTKSTTTKKAVSTKKETDKPKTTTTKKTTKKTTTTRTAKPKVEKKIEDKKEEKVVKNAVDVKEKKAEEIKQELIVEEPKKEEKAEFKKVEVNNKKEAKPKKNHRIIKAILILIIIALVLFLVNFARNFIIVNKIIEAQVELRDKTNYSYTIEDYPGNNENDKTIVKYFYKDGKCMLVTNSGIRWQDEKTKEMIVMSPTELKAIVTSSETKLLGMPTFPNENNNFLRLSFMYLITNDIVEGQECYKIRYMDEVRWVSKENGTILKDMYGKTVVNGEEYENVKYFKDWKFDQLTDNDLLRPNLIGYDVTYDN